MTGNATRGDFRRALLRPARYLKRETMSFILDADEPETRIREGVAEGVREWPLGTPAQDVGVLQRNLEGFCAAIDTARARHSGLLG